MPSSTPAGTFPRLSGNPEKPCKAGQAATRFISSCSVYADTSNFETPESAPVARLEPGADENDVQANYGPQSLVRRDDF